MTELRKFQLELLKMLEILDKIFHENELPYFLLGGSALGAVRHKGFIPWDDDIDIGLYRKDFERMEKILQDKLPINLLYCKIGENKIPNAPIGYLYNVSNSEISLSKVPTIDIFAIDNVPDNKILEKMQNIFAKVYNLCIYRNPARNRGRISYFFTKMILIIFPNFLLNYLEKLSKKIIISSQDKNTKYVNNLFGANYEKVRKEVMGEAVLKEFETGFFPIPKLYDEYLTILYGDYMKIPEKNKQQPKHKTEIFN